MWALASPSVLMLVLAWVFCAAWMLALFPALSERPLLRWFRVLVDALFPAWHAPPELRERRGHALPWIEALLSLLARTSG